MHLRSGAAFVLAGLIVFGLGNQLTWEEWQPIGWLVIFGGGALAATTEEGIRKTETWLAAAPSLTFLAGYSVFYWRLPIWQFVDVVSIGCFIGVGLINVKKVSTSRG